MYVSLILVDPYRWKDVENVNSLGLVRHTSYLVGVPVVLVGGCAHIPHD